MDEIIDHDFVKLIEFVEQNDQLQRLGILNIRLKSTSKKGFWNDIGVKRDAVRGTKYRATSAVGVVVYRTF